MEVEIIPPVEATVQITLTLTQASYLRLLCGAICGTHNDLRISGRMSDDMRSVLTDSLYSILTKEGV